MIFARSLFSLNSLWDNHGALKWFVGVFVQGSGLRD